jgi:hypothetical protein
MKTKKLKKKVIKSNKLILKKTNKTKVKKNKKSINELKKTIKKLLKKRYNKTRFKLKKYKKSKSLGKNKKKLNRIQYGCSKKQLGGGPEIQPFTDVSRFVGRELDSLKYTSLGVEKML